MITKIILIVLGIPTDCWTDDNVDMYTCAGTYVLKFIIRKHLRKYSIQCKQRHLFIKVC